EGEWPAAVRDDAVLDDRKRTLLASLRPERAPLPQSADVVAREREMFRQWCASARRQLVLSWPRLDPVTGATRLPSLIVLERASEQAGGPLDYAALSRREHVEAVPLWRAGWGEDAEPLDEAEIDTWTVAGLATRQGRRYAAALGECTARGLALDRLRQRTP